MNEVNEASPAQATLSALLGCPCCGGVAQLSNNVNYTTIFCTNCGIKTSDEYGYDYEARKIKVTNRWNKRAT
jgi:transcription elongation factor Elf1